MGSDLSVGYDVLLAQDDLVSIKFNVSTYFQGAAHPNSYADVLNFDLKNGKQLKLSDLFKPGAKYLQAIASHCIAELKEQAKEKGLLDEEIEKGAAAKSENYESWTITRTRPWHPFRPVPGRPLRRRPAVRARAVFIVERSDQP